MADGINITFSEIYTDNVKMDIQVERQIFSVQSEYQRIDVFESREFGRMIVLDGEIIFSEADEFIYNEMVVHVPMAVHPCVKNVLIIGGGDGGVAAQPVEHSRGAAEQPLPSVQRHARHPGFLHQRQTIQRQYHHLNHLNTN